MQQCILVQTVPFVIKWMEVSAPKDEGPLGLLSLVNPCSFGSIERDAAQVT